MRTMTALMIATLLTVTVLLTAYVGVLFPPLPDVTVAEEIASIETTTPPSAMGPDYIAPPPVIPVS